jgi:DNA polymerase-1
MSDINTDERKRLFSLFSNVPVEEVKETSLNKNQDSNILIIDGMNTFIRCFSAIPTLNDDGIHTGGISGFLKSIGYAIRLLNPTRCFVVFDGQGGSLRRRKIYPEYKNRRANKVRLNRIYQDDSTSESESQSIARQLVRISHYIDNLPITTIQMDNVEADDVIAYLALESFSKSNVTIMSADKDFYQIVSDRTQVYSPTKKRIYGASEVLAEYGISSYNFVLFRALDGDPSDNIDGIEGCGPKTIIKAFPFLAEQKPYTIDDLIAHAEKNESKLKVYSNVCKNKHILQRNYDLMQLSSTLIATYAQLDIGDILKKKNRLNKFAFVKMVTEDRLWNAIPNNSSWLGETFSTLDRYVI